MYWIKEQECALAILNHRVRGSNGLALRQKTSACQIPDINPWNAFPEEISAAESRRQISLGTGNSNEQNFTYIFSELGNGTPE